MSRSAAAQKQKNGKDGVNPHGKAKKYRLKPKNTYNEPALLQTPMEKIAIIGSTGTLGQKTLEIVQETPGYQVQALACFKNAELILNQIQVYKPKKIAIFDIEAGLTVAKALQKVPAKSRPHIHIGPQSWEQIAVSSEINKVFFLSNSVTALPALFAAIKKKKKIALANKEMLVQEGDKIMKMAKKYQTEIIPVDSEHSAIYQCLQGESYKSVEKIYLTCSGGPFYGKQTEEIQNVTAKEALNHPVWKMGKKISIDSATLINKGIEVIEAIHLFRVKPEQIEVIIHPQGVVHSMVQFIDGSIKSQCSNPDMRFAIQYALTYPKRLPTQYQRTSIETFNNLQFNRPDHHTFPGIQLALQAYKNKKTKQFLAANEEAVKQFLDGRITFLQIYESIKSVLDKKN